MPGLDHAFYPHLIDNILSYSESWLPMRTTNREFRDRIDRFYEHLIIAPTSWDYLDKDEPEQEVGPFLFFTPRAWISGIGPRVFGPDEPHSAREREQRVLIQRLLRLARIVDVRGYVDEYSWITDAVNDPGARVELVRLFSLPYRWESTNLLAIKAPRVIFVPVDVDPDGEPFALQAWDNYMAATDGVKQTTQNVAFNKHGEWLMLPTRQDENGDPTAVDLCRMVWMFPDWPLESDELSPDAFTTFLMFMDEIVEALKPKETKRLDIRNITIVNFPALTFEGRSIFEILQSQVRWEIWRRNMTLSLNSIPRDLDPDNVYQLLAGVRTSEEPAQAMNALAAIVSAAMVARPPPDKPKCDDDGDEDEDMDTDRPVMQPWDSYDLEGRMGLLRFISRSEYFPEVKEPRFTLETGGCNVQYWSPTLPFKPYATTMKSILSILEKEWELLGWDDEKDRLHA